MRCTGRQESTYTTQNSATLPPSLPPSIFTSQDQKARRAHLSGVWGFLWEGNVQTRAAASNQPWRQAYVAVQVKRERGKGVCNSSGNTSHS
jgi:hypothetical protein